MKRRVRIWAVARVFDDQKRRPIPVQLGLREFEAKLEAGRWRDGMTDSQVGQALREGWNYLPVKWREGRAHR